MELNRIETEEIIKKVYENHDMDSDNIADDIANGYLTENEGKDGESYYYYFDGVNCFAVNISSGEVVIDTEDLFE